MAETAVLPSITPERNAELFTSWSKPQSIDCRAELSLRDIFACLRGGVISAVFSCAFMLAIAKNFAVGTFLPHAAHLQGMAAAFEPAVWACIASSFVLIIIYSLDCRRSLTIDPLGLIINTQLYEGVYSKLLVPWGWLTRISVNKPSFASAIEFQMETKYGVLYSLKWDEVMSSTIMETLVAACRTLAPQAVLDLGNLQIESTSAQESFTELWLKGLSGAERRERTGPLVADMTLNGRYTVFGCLGAGGQGTAYLACDEQNNNASVVLKEYILPSYVTGGPVAVAPDQQLIAEAELMRALSHDNIVKMLDCFVEDYRGYLVLEYVHGDTLSQLIDQSGTLPEKQVIEIAMHVCDALQYLHAQEPPVVHQDITPGNLIMEETGRVRLVDFNVARKFTANGATTTVVGKHAYIPPEQFRGKPCPQSDIYALGCTMAYLLTGKEPEPMSASHPQRAVPTISKKLDAIVARATALSLADRYATADELKLALAELLTS